jgi:hypothetical protein
MCGFQKTQEIIILVKTGLETTEEQTRKLSSGDENVPLINDKVGSKYLLT